MILGDGGASDGTATVQCFDLPPRMPTYGTQILKERLILVEAAEARYTTRQSPDRSKLKPSSLGRFFLDLTLSDKAKETKTKHIRDNKECC